MRLATKTVRGIQEGYGLVSSTLIVMAEAILARGSSDSNDESFIVKESCGCVECKRATGLRNREREVVGW